MYCHASLCKHDYWSIFVKITLLGKQQRDLTEKRKPLKDLYIVSIYLSLDIYNIYTYMQSPKKQTCTNDFGIRCARKLDAAISKCLFCAFASAKPSVTCKNHHINCIIRGWMPSVFSDSNIAFVFVTVFNRTNEIREIERSS